jgi:hemerythrin superfamily protein
MTIYQTLKNDHDTVQELMQRLKKGQGAESDQRSFETLKMEILLHAKAEEKVFYTALRQHREAQDMVQHATREHKQVEEMLEEMSELEPQGDQFLSRLEELRSSIEDHVEEEEGEIFEAARKLLSDDEARRMDEAFQQEKRRLMSEMGEGPGAEDEDRIGARH